MHLLIALLFAIATAHRSAFKSVNTLVWTTNLADSLDELAPTINDFTITGTDDPTVAITDDLVVYLTVENGDPEKAADVLATGTAALPKTTWNEATKTWTCSDLDFTRLPLIGQGKVELHISHTPGAPVFVEVKTDITVTPAAAWTAGREGGVKLSDPAKLPALTFEDTAGDYIGWAESGMLARFTVGGKTAELAITGNDGVFTTGANGDINNLTLDITALPSTIKVEIVLIAAASPDPEVVHPQDFELPISRAPCDFTVAPATVYLEDLDLEAKPFTITPTQQAGWVKTNTYTALLNLNGATIPLVGDCNITMTADSAGTEWTLTANLSDITIGSKTQIFLWVAESQETHAFPVPFAIAYNPAPKPTGDFTVNVTSVKYEDRAAVKDIGFTNASATESTTWETTMKAEFRYSGQTVTEDVVKTTEGGTTSYTVATVNFTPLNIPNTGGQVDVFISPAGNGRYIETTTVKITVAAEDPVGPELVFDFLPETISYTDKVITISAEPIAPDTWDNKDIKCIFSFDGVNAPANEPADYTFVLAEPVTPANEVVHKKFQGTANMSKITVPKNETTIYAWIKLDDKVAPSNAVEVLEVPFPISYTHAPEAEFTVKPTKVDLRTDTKVNVEVARKATASTWEAEVYLFFSLQTVDTQPDDDKFVATTKGTDKWTGELDLSKLTGAKKDDSIYVYVKHQPATPAPTNEKTGTFLAIPAVIAVDKSTEPEPEAAMGVSPLLSLLAAALLLLVKLF